MEFLAKLLRSETRLRMLRLFIFNPNSIFDNSEIEKRTNSNRGNVLRELIYLRQAGIIVRKAFSQFLKNSRKNRSGIRKQKNGSRQRMGNSGWTLNNRFQYFLAIRSLLVETIPSKSSNFAKRFSRAGNIRLFIISGIFINDPDSRVDMLLVGDKLKKRSLEGVIKRLEREMGIELRYVILETADFIYRKTISDKLVRDILEYPHKRLIDKIL